MQCANQKVRRKKRAVKRNRPIRSISTLLFPLAVLAVAIPLISEGGILDNAGGAVGGVQLQHSASEVAGRVKYWVDNDTAAAVTLKWDSVVDGAKLGANDGLMGPGPDQKHWEVKAKKFKMISGAVFVDGFLQGARDLWVPDPFPVVNLSVGETDSIVAQLEDPIFDEGLLETDPGPVDMDGPADVHLIFTSTVERISTFAYEYRYWVTNNRNVAVSFSWPGVDNELALGGWSGVVPAFETIELLDEKFNVPLISDLAAHEAYDLVEFDLGVGDGNESFIAGVFAPGPLPVPTLNEWGLVVMALLLLTASAIIIGRARLRTRRA